MSIVVNEQDFTIEFNKFFQKTSLFSLDLFHNHAPFIDSRKVKIFQCTYFNFIKISDKLLKAFLSILIRLYLNYFFLC